MPEVPPRKPEDHLDNAPPNTSAIGRKTKRCSGLLLGRLLPPGSRYGYSERKWGTGKKKGWWERLVT